MKIKTNLSNFYTIDTYHTFDIDTIMQDTLFDESEVDSEGYTKDLGYKHAEILDSALVTELDMYDNDRSGPVQRIELVEVSSPRYYNYSSDSATTEVTIDRELLVKYMIDNATEFSKYLKDNFTSYDGFWSFVPNNLKEFTEELENKPDVEDRNLGIIVGWYMTREVISEEKYLEDMYEAVNEIAWNNTRQFTDSTLNEYNQYVEKTKEPLEIEEWVRERDNA